jgi:hypothetical protein
MNIRKAIAVSGLLVLAATPFATHAGGADRALNACVSAFVDTYVPDRIVRVRKVHPPAGVLDIRTNRSRAYTIALSARGARSGELLAEARCVASGRGDVIVLDSPPAETYVAKADFSAVVAR